MTIGLTVLLGLLSAGILVGRVYEILKLTDTATGFFLYKGIVFNPYILIIFLVVTVCCAILIFGSCKSTQPFFSQSSKLIAVAAGVMFLIYGVMALKSSAAAPFIIAGGAAFAAMGIFGLRENSTLADVAVILLGTAFIVGLCLDVIIFNVSTIYNIDFTKNALSYLALAVFMMFVMKNVYQPSATAKMLLFIAGITAFLFCGVMHIADIIAMAINGQAVLPDLFFRAGFGFVGFFAFDNAISVMSKKVQFAAEEEINETAEQNAVIYRTNAVNAQTEFLKTAEKKVFSETAVPTQQKEMINFFKNGEVKESPITVEAPEKRFFARSESDKKTSSRKDGAKVVYKKPKN